MTPIPDRAILDALVSICRQAGDAILEIYGGEFCVAEKADSSPLTQADLASHRIICAALRELASDIPVLSEESAELPWSERRQWPVYWLVDPLDGTKEFINRNGEFTVNIAMIREHEPVAGVVHVPVTGATYYGSRDLGAFRLSGGNASRIRVRTPPSDPLVVVGSRSHANPVLEQKLAALGPYQLVSMGSSLKFCLVAEGEADFYPRLGPTSEWDTAAAQAVVEAAGGKVVKLDGDALRYNTKSSLLNPEFLVFGDDNRDWAGLMSAPAS